MKKLKEKIKNWFEENGYILVLILVILFVIACIFIKGKIIYNLYFLN